MKAWQIFLVGTIAIIALLFSPIYQSALAGVVALLIVAAVIVGFCLRPRTEVFHLRTTIHVADPDFGVAIHHDQIAVRVELSRLWLLFIPTFSAVAFLLVTGTSDTTWNMSLFDSLLISPFGIGPYPKLVFFRFLIIAVFALLAAWMSERWVLWDASACNAGSVWASEKRIHYSFQDPSGEYYGGEGIPLGGTRSPQLRAVVLYRTGKPDLNKIAMCCLFHRLVIVGHGVPDLGEAKGVTGAVKAKPATQPL